MALEAGSRLGPYEVVGLLDAGAMGEVYRARDPRLERQVAIKVVSEAIADRRHLLRFEQEARAAGALNHPNVLAIYDVGTHEGVPYVVSELLEGHTLKFRLLEGALPVRKALDFALQIAHGLAAAHDKGIVHRDLKPDNVFITEDGRVKLIDFGLAKLTQQAPLAKEVDRRAAAEATESGMVLGTVSFMSPEQVRGEEVDHRSDIFSFGAVLHEMLSGERAFRRDSAVETMSAILKEDPPELPGTGRRISPGLARIVRRCLEKRAGDRFQSAHDLALALEAASSGLSAEADASPDAGLVGWAKRRRNRLLGALAAMVLVAGGLYPVLVRRPASPMVDPVGSVAVLPFENVGGDPEREYLSDGIAESLINALSRLPDLKVIARSTSFRFRGKDVDPQRVGHDLGVGAVLTGRVSQRGDTVAIGTELVDVVQGTQLWGERYDTTMGDISAVQETIARDISRKLRRKPTPRDETPRTRRHSANGEAYRLYLLSRYEFNKLITLETSTRAVEYARQATEKDPAYAAAWAALADSYSQLGTSIFMPAREAFSKAKTAATKALEIDEWLPEAHKALAVAVLTLDRDWVGAEREFKEAIELDPNSADAHQWYGIYLQMVGSLKEGIEHVKRAVELDPLSPRRHLFLSIAYYHAREFDQALEGVRAASKLDPESPAPHFILAWIYREKGMYQEAIAEFRMANATQSLGGLGNAYARAGRVREAEECLREMKRQWKEDHIGVYDVVFIYAGLDDKDHAFEWLERAYEEGDPGLLSLKIDPLLDPLRTDPRFKDFVRRMNYP